MPDFHLTGIGRKFYDHQLPHLTEQLKRIADALEILATQPAVTTVNQMKPMVKNKACDYTLTISGDKWHIYKDMYNINKIWRAERIDSNELPSTYTGRYKTEVVSNIYSLYNKS